MRSALQIIEDWDGLQVELVEELLDMGLDLEIIESLLIQAQGL